MSLKIFVISYSVSIMIFFQIELNSATPHRQFFTNTAKFVGDLVSKSLIDCKLYFVYGNFQKSTLTQKQSNIWHDGLENLVTPKYIQDYSGGVTTLHLSGNQTKDLFPIYRSPRTLSNSCSATVLLLPTEITQVEEFILTERLTKPYINPATIKNQDKYLIVSEKATLTSLYDSRLVSGIKYKLIVTSDRHNQVLAHRFCPHCPEGRIKIVDKYPAEVISDVDFYFPDLQKNYYGSVLKTSASDKLPGLLEIVPSESGKFLAKRGVYASALFHLIEKLNFTYDLIPSSGGGSTGHPLPNGTWVGTVGDAYSGRTDFGLMAGLTFIRFPIIELCATITFEYISFATGPPVKIYTWKAIFWPFSPYLWIGMIASMLLCVIVSYFLLKNVSSRQHTDENKHCKASSYKWNILSIAQYYARTFIEQGDELPNVPEPIRVLIGYWLLFVLVAATAYKSKMVSLLTFPVVENLPDNFNELEKSNYDIRFHYFGNVAYNTFKTSTNPTYKNIFQRMEREPNPLKCLKETMNSKSACILFGITYDELRYRNLSDRFGHSPIQLSPNYGFMYTPGVLHQKKAALSINFKRVINTAMEMGLIGQWQKSDLNQVLKNKNAWEEENNIESFGAHILSGNRDVLHLPNLIGSFTILIVGLLGAIIAFFGEYFYFLYKNQRLLTFHGLRLAWSSGPVKAHLF